MNVEEAKEVKVKLAEPTISIDDIINLLRKLEESKLTKDVIEKSKLGVEVNKIRKRFMNDAKVSGSSMRLLTKWKEIVLGKRRANANEGEVGTDDSLGRVNEEEVVVNMSKKSRVHSEGNAVAETSRIGSDTGTDGSVPKDPAKNSRNPCASLLKDRFIVNDPIRDKCFEMLINALLISDQSGSQEEPDELILSTCRLIEENLFKEFGQASAAYKAKFRSKYLNLKDKHNDHLRESLLTGVLSPSTFVAMTASEMASSARREADLKLIEQNLKNARAAQDNEAETDQFKCGRCRQRRTKYYQLQTRSADEPMTTFVTCVNCGNRWKFC